MHFAKHETFHIRDGWLYKGLRAVEADPTIFLAANAPEQLGLGNNMVRALRFWMQATGLTREEQDNRRREQIVTGLGQLILQHDPYQELDGTLWLIHHQLIRSYDLATAWYWFFNVYTPVDFTKSEFIERLNRWIDSNPDRGEGEPIAENSLQRDFECLVRTYLISGRDRSPEDQIESPLANLDLIKAFEEKDDETGQRNRRYRLLQGEARKIPSLIFLYILLCSQELERAETDQLSLSIALRHPGNVGRTFNIGVQAFEELLVRLEDNHPDYAIRLTRTGGLDQLALPRMSAANILRQYFEEQQW